MCEFRVISDLPQTCITGTPPREYSSPVLGCIHPACSDRALDLCVHGTEPMAQMLDMLPPPPRVARHVRRWAELFLVGVMQDVSAITPDVESPCSHVTRCAMRNEKKEKRKTRYPPRHFHGEAIGEDGQCRRRSWAGCRDFKRGLMGLHVHMGLTREITAQYSTVAADMCTAICILEGYIL